MPQIDLYDPAFVRRLFDEMARTYGVVNLISSLGFARRWRRQCLRSIEISHGATVLDLMTGMGELCPDIARLVGSSGRIKALDLSPVMCDRVRQQIAVNNLAHFDVIQADALDCPVADESVDCVVSTFGLKTMNPDQLARLAQQVHRVLRPGGQFAFLEISAPAMRLLRLPYLAYIRHIIPLIGRLALGNPENYRLLGVYTIAFGDCRRAAECFTDAQLEVDYHSFFFGCATGFSGRKPMGNSGNCLNQAANLTESELHLKPPADFVGR